MYEGYEFLAAKNYRTGRDQDPTVIVVHTIEADQTTHTARNVADYFHTQTGAPTSAHGIVDSGQLIRLVRDEDTAYAAGTHGNRIGLHLEHAGRAGYDARQWGAPYTAAMLALSAKQIAAWCRKWNIPAVRIGPADLLAGKRGICGHIDITHAWPGDTTHWDPGPNWPWDQLLALVRAELNPTPAPAPTPAPPTEDDDMLLITHTSGIYLLSGGKIVGLTGAAYHDAGTSFAGVPRLAADDAQWTRLTAAYGPAAV